MMKNFLMKALLAVMLLGVPAAQLSAQSLLSKLAKPPSRARQKQPTQQRRLLKAIP